MPETKRKYDPVKRKEYYERTKQLKGRKKGPSKAETSFRSGERATSTRAAKKAPVIAELTKKASELQKKSDVLGEALIDLSTHKDKYAYDVLTKLDRNIRQELLSVEGEIMELNREISGAKRLDKMSNTEFELWRRNQSWNKDRYGNQKAERV